VSGLNRLLAGRIIKYRNEKGAFASREDLKKVSGMGEKTFQQAAGFLRIPGGTHPLDNSSVHPERYSFITTLAQALGTTVEQLIGNAAALRSVDKKKFISEDIGLPTIEDIFSELEKPGRDPRATFTYAHFSQNVREVSDLKEEMVLEGTVTNVTNFGAFVDIGVHQDGLVHISELSDSFVTDPKQVVKAGQIVKVRVLKVDTVLKRISLSMKSGSGASHRGNNNTSQGAGRPEQQSKLPHSGKPSDEPKKLVTSKPKFSMKQFMR
jgi:uncharacterized protein